MAKLTSTIILAAIDGFESQKKEIDTQIAELRAILAAEPENPPAAAPKGARRKFSAAARQRMREAQKLRWAKIRGGPSATAVKATSGPAKVTRGITAAGRKALSIAMKKRWAAKKSSAK